MSFADVRRNTLSVRLLTRLAAEQGMSEEDCLRDSGIPGEALASPQTEITAAQELQVVRNLVMRLGDRPGLGLEAGSRYHLASYGSLGFAVASAPDYRSASEIALRYFDLSHGFVQPKSSATGRHFEITLDDSAIPQALKQFVVERDFASIMVAGEEIWPGGFPVRAAFFRFPEPAYADLFRRFTGVAPVFGAAQNLIELDPAFLHQPPPLADPVVARVCEDYCRQLLIKRRVRTGTAAAVRDLLSRTPAQMPDIGTAAQALCMAARSLRRRLDEEGTSFRQLVDEVRQTLAEELLITAQMKVEEIARSLGYSEAASFSHAFKRWKGVSPNVFRAQSARLEWRD